MKRSVPGTASNGNATEIHLTLVTITHKQYVEHL